MSKKLTHLFSFVLVLGLVITSVAKGADPDLLVWYKFDETSGTIAHDSSGNGHDGTLNGDPKWVPGQINGALDFGGDGDFVVDEDGEDYINGLTAISITMWIKSDVVGTDSGFIIFADPSGNDQRNIRYDQDGGEGDINLLKYGMTYTSGNEEDESPANLQTTDWQHVAVTTASGAGLTLYINGVLVIPEEDDVSETGVIVGCTTLIVGKGGKDDGATASWDGLIDDVRIYSRVLTEAEIQQIMVGIPPGSASDPTPANEATDVPQEVTLTWRAGAYVEGLSPKHRVFFSENFDDVNDGIGGIEQDVERYPIDGSLSLDMGKTCYWRVDEANGTTGWDVGDLWRFTVIDHFVVDGFEDYNDYPPNEIFNTWIDGYDNPANGSTVGYPDPDFLQGEHYVETKIVHGGKQSMPYYYNNTGTATYSEAERTFSPAQDWTREGVRVLSLWFRGYPGYVGSFVEAPAGTYTMTAAGTDIWDVADEFHFAYKELSGAAVIIAKVESVENTDPWAKAGVMIRDTLDGDSANVTVLITPENGVRFQYRKTAGGSTERDFAEGITAPQWVKLERTTGGLVRAYYSADGTAWTMLNLTIVSMNMPVYTGLAVTSHNVDATCEAKFSNVSFGNTSVGPQWTDQDVGMIRNEAEPMYVTVGDGSSTAATVYHDNPGATQIDTWTEWNIPLTDLSNAGVVLTDVSKLAIGFGDRNNPQAGGSGTMYFDDIRLYPSRCILSVMSFNIRYGTANDGENHWKNRREMVFDVFRNHHPDIVGLQEARDFQIAEIRKALAKYGQIGVAREDGKTEGEYSAILYRLDRFDVDESGTFWLSDTPEVPGSSHWGNAHARICTWARFVEKKSGKAFYLYNTHLDHVSQPSREKSAVLLAQRIRDRRHLDPFVVTGDFNAGEDNPVVTYLKGMTSLVGPDGRESSSPVPMVDTFRVLHPDIKDVRTGHSFRGTRQGNKIDYVFAPPDVKVLDAQILYDNVDGRYPSDHFPVTARLLLPAVGER